MKAKLIIHLLLTSLLAACNLENQTSLIQITPSVQQQEFKSTHEITITPSFSLKTSKQTPTLTFPSNSPKELLPTSTPKGSMSLDENQLNNCGKTLLTFKDNDFELFKFYDDMVVLNEYDFWIMSRGVLYHFQNGALTQQVLLQEDDVVYAIAFEVLGSSFWIYDQDRWPEPGSEIKLLNINIEGRVIRKYIIPKNLLIDKNGNYVENGFADLWWGSTGELYLGGIQGAYQLLSDNGEFNIKAVNGYQQNNHTYIPLNFKGSSLTPILFHIDDFTFPITTTFKTMILGGGFFPWGLVAVMSDDSFIVQVEEANLPYEKPDWQAGKPAIQFSLRHYSIEGHLLTNLICMTKQDANTTSSFHAVQGRDKKIYLFLVDYEKRRVVLNMYQL